MRHPEEVMDLMEALTEDGKYKEVVPIIKEIENEGGQPTMRSALDELVKRTEGRMRNEMNQKVKKSFDQGRMDACKSMAKSLLVRGGLTKEEIQQLTQLSKNEIDEIEKTLPKAE